MSENATIFRVEIRNGDIKLLSAPAKITSKSIRAVKGGKDDFYKVAGKLMLPKFELGKSVYDSADDAIEAEADRVMHEALEHRRLAHEADDMLGRLETLKYEVSESGTGATEVQ